MSNLLERAVSALCVHHTWQGGEGHPPTLSQVEKGALRESLGEFDMCPLEIEEDKSWCLTLI